MGISKFNLALCKPNCEITTLPPFESSDSFQYRALY